MTPEQQKKRDEIEDLKADLQFSKRQSEWNSAKMMADPDMKNNEELKEAWKNNRYYEELNRRHNERLNKKHDTRN